MGALLGNDPIIEEIHRIRREYAARFNFDIRAMCRDGEEREARGEFRDFQRADLRPVTPVLLKSEEHPAES